MRAFAKRLPLLRAAVVALRRTRARRFEQPTAPLDYRRQRLVVRVSSAEVARARLHPVAKEPWTVEWLERSVRPDDVVWDVGANVGAYSLIAATLGARTVVAFEPGYATYATLCDNIFLNGLERIVVPLPVALGSASAVTSFGYRDLRAGAASHTIGGSEQALAALSLPADEVVERLGVAGPTLVKLDVDGAEAEVLAGGPSVFAAPSLRAMIVEVERAREQELTTSLGDAGLQLVERIDHRDGVRLAHVFYGIFERR